MHKFHRLTDEYKNRINLAINSLKNCSYTILYWISDYKYSEDNEKDIDWLQQTVASSTNSVNYFAVDMQNVIQLFRSFENWQRDVSWLSFKWPWQLASLPELIWYANYRTHFENNEINLDAEDIDIWILEYDVAWKGDLQQLISQLQKDYDGCDYVGFDCFTKYTNWQHYSKHTSSYLYNVSNGEPFSCLIQAVKTKPKLLRLIIDELLENKISYCEIQTANLCYKRHDCKLCDFYRVNNRKRKNPVFGTFFSSTHFDSQKWQEIVNDDEIPSSLWHSVKI